MNLADQPAQLQGKAGRGLKAALTAAAAATGVQETDLGGGSAMAAMPGGLGQRVHQDGGNRAGQETYALVLALHDETEATRFASSNERTGRERRWSDCTEGTMLKAGQAILFRTKWFHAGPGVAKGRCVRRTVFIPITGAPDGGKWRVRNGSEKAPVFRSAQKKALK